MMTATENATAAFTFNQYIESASLTELASRWWQTIAPYADRCFVTLTDPSVKHYTDAQIEIVRELYAAAEFVAEMPCPIPMTTARRQLLAAIDATIASYQSAITGSPEIAHAANSSAIGHIHRVRATLSAFGVTL